MLRKDSEDSTAARAAPKATGKRRRAAPVSTASTLQAKALFASTRDELLDIQKELAVVAEERRALVAAAAADARDGRSESKSVLYLLPASDKKAA